MTVTPNSTPGNAVDAEVRGRFFIARNVPLQDGTNSLQASTDATTLAGNSPSSDTVDEVALDTSVDEAYTYNANGDLILKSEEGGSILWTYSYSVDGWLVKVEGPDSVVEEYFYDPTGRKYMVSTTENQQTTTRYFVYDGESVVLELDASLALSKEFVRGLSLGGGIGGLLYVRDANDTVGCFHYDGQGNVVSVTDAARAEIAYYEYDAWGNILTACGSLANEFAFSTKQSSTNTGLIDFGYRWYDPQTGRWIQRDPAGIAGGPSLYAYVENNPVGGIDPLGMVELKSDKFRFRCTMGRDHQDVLLHFDLHDASGRKIGSYILEGENIGWDDDCLRWLKKKGLLSKANKLLKKFIPMVKKAFRKSIRAAMPQIFKELSEEVGEKAVKEGGEEAMKKAAKKIVSKFGGPIVLIAFAAWEYQDGGARGVVMCLTGADMIETADQLAQLAVDAAFDAIEEMWRGILSDYLEIVNQDVDLNPNDFRIPGDPYE